jgi:hypothetical protein
MGSCVAYYVVSEEVRSVVDDFAVVDEEVGRERGRGRTAVSAPMSDPRYVCRVIATGRLTSAMHVEWHSLLVVATFSMSASSVGAAACLVAVEAEYRDVAE